MHSPGYQDSVVDVCVIEFTNVVESAAAAAVHSAFVAIVV